MKKIFLFILTFSLSFNLFSQGVAINADGSNPDNSAILDVKSTSKGILIPRMTQTQRNNITSPTTGLMVFQTDNTSGFYYYNGSSWVPIDTDTNSGGSVTSITAGTGLDGGTITTSGTISMPNVGTAGTYGSATQTPIITTDAQGRITSVTNTTISGVDPAAGSPNYIQNGTTQQTSANYNIDGNGTLGGDINVNGSDINGPGISGGASGILRVNSNTDIRMVLDKDANGSQQFDIAPNGGSTAVFTVTEAGNVTANGYMRMLEGGTTPTYYTTLQSGDLTANTTFTLPTSTGTAGQFLQTNGTGTLSFYTLGGAVMAFHTSVSNASTITSQTGSATYYYLMPTGTLSTEASTQIKMPKCQITRMRIVFNSNGLNSGSTFTLRKNGAATAIAITQAASTATTAESTGTITFADGDLLSVQGVLGGTSGQTIGVIRIEITYYLVP